MKLVATVYEATCDAAVQAIRALTDGHDMVEVRAERFPSIDHAALRAATARPIILTYRNAELLGEEQALAAGIDFVDVEWREGVKIAAPSRTVLSHHDYDGMLDVGAIVRAMRERGCAHTKLAATPQSFADNERLLALLGADRTTTVIGMGERGLYSRILAPFRGSALAFAAATAVAAPAQLTLERAAEIYGPDRNGLSAEKVFAVVGNPAGHSLSPSIHNRLFREKSVPAAYTIASVERFEEVTRAFLGGEPCGLSVTAPFKDDAFRFACEQGAEIGANAREAEAVNTLVNTGGRIFADNTDVDGFGSILPRASSAAIIGAGGTARAARVALGRLGIPVTVFNRTASKGDRPLSDLAAFSGDLVINTLPAGVDVALPRCDTYVEAAYGGPPRAVETARRIDGLALLNAQALRQHQLFMKVFA